jgi:hypothetical protein
MSYLTTVQQVGVGNTAAVKLYYMPVYAPTGLLVTLWTGSATMWVDVSGDGTHWNPHDVLQNLTASANSNLAVPVPWVRLRISAGTGTAVLNVVQAVAG